MYFLLTFFLLLFLLYSTRKMSDTTYEFRTHLGRQTRTYTHPSHIRSVAKSFSQKIFVEVCLSQHICTNLRILFIKSIRITHFSRCLSCVSLNLRSSKNDHFIKVKQLRVSFEFMFIV